MRKITITVTDTNGLLDKAVIVLPDKHSGWLKIIDALFEAGSEGRPVERAELCVKP